MVLYCCLHDITYDWQVEGVKGDYLYSAICELGDDEKIFFEPVITEKFLSRCNNTLFYQLSEILSCYAYDGNEKAKEAFEKKYDYFCAKRGRLLQKHRFDEGMQWDETAYELFKLDGFSKFKQHAANVGKILNKHPEKRIDFDKWFIYYAEDFFGKKRIQTFFDKNYEKSIEIKALVDALKADKINNDLQSAKRKTESITVDELMAVAQAASFDKNPRYKFAQAGHKFRRCATEEAFTDLANKVLKEDNKTIKALLLLPFSFIYKLEPYLFPQGIDVLPEYIQSDNDFLSEVAIGCLEKFKDNKVHDFAIEFLQTKGIKALSLLGKNYRKSDDVIIYKALKKANIVSHDVQRDICDIYLRNSSINAFPTLLHVYQKGDCTFCRYQIVKAMHNCKVLTNEILEECLYDSSEDTRVFAKQLIKKRTEKTFKQSN